MAVLTRIQRHLDFTQGRQIVKSQELLFDSFISSPLQLQDMFPDYEDTQCRRREQLVI